MKSYIKYWQNVVAILIVSGLLSFPGAASAIGNIVFEQAPGHEGGFPADGKVFVTGDDFRFDQNTFITSITWWGGYYREVVPTDDFTIYVYTDNGDQVGSLLLQAFDVGNSAARTPTGGWVAPPYSSFPGRPEFQYSFDLPTAFLAQANTRYWLSITNAPRPGITDWEWEMSANPVNLDVLHGSQSEPWHLFTGDFPGGVAFQLEASAVTVAIDIKPGSSFNTIKRSSIAKIPVAILSNSTFSAPNQVIPESLTFGPTGNEDSFIGCSSPVDVNADGRKDLVCNFNIPAAGFQLGDTIGVLKGFNFYGEGLIGIDFVQVVP